METDDLNIESTSGSTQTEESWYVLTLRQMYILAAVSQLNCLMALGMRQMKVRPADLLGRLRGLLYCKWQRPPSPSPSTSLCPCPQSPLHAVSLSVGSEARFPKRRPLARPQAVGTLTSSNDLQPGLSLCSSSTHSHHKPAEQASEQTDSLTEPTATSAACAVPCPATFSLGSR